MSKEKVKIDNPFVTTGYVGDEYFCDREKETKDIIRYLTNGNNVALISPRRYGKSDLLRHCFTPGSGRFQSGDQKKRNMRSCGYGC